MTRVVVFLLVLGAGAYVAAQDAGAAVPPPVPGAAPPPAVPDVTAPPPATAAPPPVPSQEPPGPCAYDASIQPSDCPAQSCYAGPPNGCGSRSLAIIAADIIPDRWPAGVDFTAACNTHDTCYFTPGSVKDTCDNAFREALLAECRRALGCISVPILGQQCFSDPSSNPLFAACRELADVYVGAVQRVGQEPFARDQQEAQQYAEQCRQQAAQRAGG